MDCCVRPAHRCRLVARLPGGGLQPQNLVDLFWEKETHVRVNLLTHAAGFILVDEFLQCKGGPDNVFAAGDVASMDGYPRPKAGVFAVRAVRIIYSSGGRIGIPRALFSVSMSPCPYSQGPPLAENLRRHLTGQQLQRYVPQSTYLSLITAGDRYAVAVKGWLGEGRRTAETPQVSAEVQVQVMYSSH